MDNTVFLNVLGTITEHTGGRTFSMGTSWVQIPPCPSASGLYNTFLYLPYHGPEWCPFLEGKGVPTETHKNDVNSVRSMRLKSNKIMFIPFQLPASVLE